MRAALLLLVLGATAVGASAQGIIPGGYASFPTQPAPPNTALLNPALSFTELPMWTYSVTAGADLGGGTYSGTIIGRNPHLPGKTTTTIPLKIVPVILVINNGSTDNHTYNPTVNDGCEPGTHNAVDIVQNSPVFQPSTWIMDGVNVGTTQYHDAFTRASFWSLVAGSSYHLVENVQVLSPVTIGFGSAATGSFGAGTNYNVPVTFGGGCGFMGVVHINDLQTALNTVVADLSPTVNIGTLPMLLVNAVVADFNTGTPSIFSNCCALGFHSSYNVGPNLQVTSIFDLDYSGLFGNNDVTVISHELGEAIFDPTGNNPTPVWGNIGQDAGNCPSGGGQNNLEVGDPLSPGFGTPTNEFVLTGGNGLTYHLQELAFFSWFYGGTNLGIAGHYSDNGTFTGDMKLCSLGGGTN
jgi:hypothetical protein